MMRRNINQKFNIDVEKMLWFPGNVYWKDKNNALLGCNDLVAELAGVKSRTEITSMTDYTAPWSNCAESYRRHEQEVIKSGKIKIFSESVTTIDKKRFHGFSMKMPLRTKAGEIIGIFGLSVMDDNLDVINTFNIFSKFTQEPNGSGSDTKLSIREKECVYYLSRGMTAKQIGKRLDLSYRTIEFYFERIKNKLNCRDRRELIAKAIDSGFLNKNFHIDK